jgi:cytochrome P450
VSLVSRLCIPLDGVAERVGAQGGNEVDEPRAAGGIGMEEQRGGIVCLGWTTMFPGNQQETHVSKHTSDSIDVAALPLVPANPLRWPQRATMARQYHQGQIDLRESGGPVTRVVLGPAGTGPSIVFVMTPTGARDALARNHNNSDRTLVHQEMRQLMGDNLADLPNAPWIARKRTLQQVFTPNQVKVFATHMAAAGDTIAQAWGEESTINLDAEARRLTMRVLGRTVLGMDIENRAEALAEPLNIALSYVADRGMRPVRAPHWLPTPARRRARTAVATMRELASEVVAECRAHPDRDAPLVQALIQAADPETGAKLSDFDISSDLIAFMVAGHDTTATSIAYALWQLGRHPEIQSKVAEEALALGDRPLTPDDLQSLTYTTQVAREAMRLCPPVAVAGRTAMRDIAVDGYRVTRGTMVLVGIFGMHRDPALWPDPLVFDPDRFTQENMRAQDRWQYIPFGAGPRNCIGDHFAMYEAVLALAAIVRTAEIESLDPNFPLAVPFTMVAGAPIPAKVTVRSTI